MFANFIKQIFGGRNPDDFVRARIDTWSDWLRPLHSVDGSGIGRDPGYDDAFMTVKEEIGKLSDIDDALIASSCEQLIKEVGKDLRLAGYYVFARVRQDGAAGFADGLELAAALIDRFGPALLRSDRQRYLQRWVMARVADHAGRADTALHLLGELDEGGQAYQLARWEPSLTFEVKHHLLTTLKALLTRKDADKPALAQRIEKLRGELTVLDPARAVALL